MEFVLVMMFAIPPLERHTALCYPAVPSVAEPGGLRWDRGRLIQ